MARHRRASKRPNEPPMPDALAYFLTWTTYGTWLPGDQRGWARRGKGMQLPDPSREARARTALAESPCTLNASQRALVEETIRRHCEIRNWHLYAVNCRSNHVHVVVSAPVDPEVVRDQLKAWCTRRLRESESGGATARREKWWTERGSERSLGDDESLEAAILYVRDAQ
jgi:REP element-mobilizing transposase RayT